MTRATDAILHFTPVGLSIFCWTIGLAYYSYYEGFSDGEPATWLSLTLILVCLALLLPATWNPALEPAKRKVAGLLSFVAAVALVDERFQGHENVGYFVKDHAKFIPKEVRHYTDDVLILIGAIVGGMLLYRCVRSVADKQRYAWYLFWAITAAVCHGILDVLGHGKYIWKVLLHRPPGALTSYLNDTASYFEESCKLWTEWFVILFLLAFLYGRRGQLLWSAQLFATSMLAVVGIWVVESPGQGIPYIGVPEMLGHYIRNYHLLLTLSLIWIAWALIVWYRHRDDESSRNVAALFFLSPFYLLIPRIAALPETLGLPAVAWVPSALVAVAVLGWSAHRWGPRVLYALLPFGLLGFSVDRVTTQPLQLLLVGGVFFPVALFFVLREKRVAWPAVAAVLVAAAVIHNPLWWVGAWAVVLACSIGALRARNQSVAPRVWAGLIALQILTIAGILSLQTLDFLPNNKYRPRGLTLFETGRQPVVRN